MGKIFYVMGKSTSGEDTMHKQLYARMPEFKTVCMCATRPIRDGETDGVEYFLVDDGRPEQCREGGILIGCRTYDTVYGSWDHFTVDDGQIDLEHGFYLVMGTLESYEKMRLFHGSEALAPLYIHVEDGLRLRRALEREEQQKVLRHKEMCCRFLADEEDLKLENLERCGTERWHQNVMLEDCLGETIDDVGMFVGSGK